GFRVTEAGRKVLEAANHLFEAHRSFQSSVANLRGETVGILRLGIVDNTITNPDARIREALGRVAQAAEGIQIAITIGEPVSLERALLEGRADAAIAAFHHHAPGLAYEPLLREEQALYCGQGHPPLRRARLHGRTSDAAPDLAAQSRHKRSHGTDRAPDSQRPVYRLSPGALRPDMGTNRQHAPPSAGEPVLHVALRNRLSTRPVA